MYPSPAALITSIDDQGRPNIITLGEVFNISIRKSAQPLWQMWQGTNGYTWAVGNAGIIELLM